jgi:hypothetical protein
MIYIVGGVIAVIVAAILAYYGARYLKGRLELEMLRDSAASNETLAGRIYLEAKKPMRGSLKVSLVGREQRRRRNRENQDTTEWVEVYRHDLVLEETRDFAPGFTQEYRFELQAPTAAEARRGGDLIRQAAAEVGDGVLGSVMQMAAGAADMMQGRIVWHVEGRVDVKGVDLYAKRQVTVNLRS